VLDPSKPAHARADQRLRSEPIAWLTTVRHDGQAQSSPGPFAGVDSTAIRVRPTRLRAW
jgi:hypothetical protein